MALDTTLLGARLAAPLVISAMTGGTREAATINRRLAAAAAEHGVALVLGSGRALLDDPALLPTYRPPGAARPPLLLANLGAAQMRGPGAAERAERLVDLLGADGLTVHLNPVQEAVQPEGEAGLRRRAGGHRRRRPSACVRGPSWPRRSASGSTPRTSGCSPRRASPPSTSPAPGGTNWALIEGRRDTRAGAVAAAFAGWGTGDGGGARPARSPPPRSCP